MQPTSSPTVQVQPTPTLRKNTPTPTHGPVLARNVFSNYATVAVASVLGLVLVPLLFRGLGPTGFAILAFALAVFSLLEGMDFGLTTAVIRFVSDLQTRGQEAELVRLVNAVFFFLAAIGAAFALAVAALSGLLTGFFVQGAPAADAWMIVLLLGAGLAFQLPGAALNAYLSGLHDFYHANMVEVSVHLFRGASIIALLYLEQGLVAIALVYPLGAMLRLLGLLLVSARAPVPFRPRISELDLGSIRRIRGFSLHSFAHHISLTLFHSADIFLVAKLLPLPHLALLAVARRIPWGLVSLLRPALAVAYPIVSSAASRDDRRACGRFVLVSTRNLLVLLLPLGLGLFLWSGVILELWMGTQMDAAVPIFRSFMVFVAFAGLQEGPFVMLYGLGHMRFTVTVGFIALAAGVVLGAWAALAIGTWALVAVFAAVQALSTAALYARTLRLVDLSLMRLLQRSVLPVVFTSIPVWAWLVLSYRLLPATVPSLAVSLGIASLLFLAFFVDFTAARAQPNWPGRLRSLLLEVEPEDGEV